MRTPDPKIQEAHIRGIISGAKAAAKVAKQMIESGWTDMNKSEAEIWRRLRPDKNKQVS